MSLFNWFVPKNGRTILQDRIRDGKPVSWMQPDNAEFILTGEFRPARAGEFILAPVMTERGIENRVARVYVPSGISAFIVEPTKELVELDNRHDSA